MSLLRSIDFMEGSGLDAGLGPFWTLACCLKLEDLNVQVAQSLAVTSRSGSRFQ